MTDTIDRIHPDLRSLALPIDSLHEDPRNANDHNAIAASFIEFGQRKPIVVRREGMIVEAGNGTLAALRAAGWTHLACVVCDDDEERAIAYGLADNQAAKHATWNFGQLRENVEATLAGYGAVLGNLWSGDQLANILAGQAAAFNEQLNTTPPTQEPPASPPAPTTLPDTDEVPEPPRESITKFGDVWILGDHRLMCGDSFDADARGVLLEGELAAMVLTDPPFAIYGSSTGIGADIADDKMIRPFFRDLGFAFVQSVVEFAHVYVCCDWRSWASVWAGMTGAKLSPKNCLVWDKGGGGLGSMYAQCHEFVGFFVRTPPQLTMLSGAITGHRQVYKPNLLRFNRAHGEDRPHNAAKPVDMATELIENSSDPGDIVLDLFGGGGSTLIAAERSGRRARLMEIEPRWCDVIVARWETVTGRKAVLASSCPAP